MTENGNEEREESGGEEGTTTAHFVRSSITKPFRPFHKDGSLNEKVIEPCDISFRTLQIDRRRPMPTALPLNAAHDFCDRGFVVGSISELCECVGVPRHIPMGVFSAEQVADEGKGEEVTRTIRQVAHEFWSTPSLGQKLLLQRFGPTAEDSFAMPTHVTFRAAPPDGMALAHVDYDRKMSLEKLASEWWGRWRRYIEHFASSPTEFASAYDLVGVTTLWMCLQPQENGMITNYPLLVGDASTAKEEDRVVYSVGSRHSVGIRHSSDIRWYHSPNMVWGDFWAFDTRATPHVTVNLTGGTEDFVRCSAEVRSLILRRKGL